jgi:7,8-dihydropterin-6-yl-methyl-4-(beta-D-ribofuranosyl)aminobenzene 5'-phosphate synthase
VLNDICGLPPWCILGEANRAFRSHLISRNAFLMCIFLFWNGVVDKKSDMTARKQIRIIKELKIRPRLNSLLEDGLLHIVKFTEYSNTNMAIQQIERISITILMDNATDLLLRNSAHTSRMSFAKKGKLSLPLPVAEHGFSALITIIKDINLNWAKNMNKDATYTYLFDTGVSDNGVIHNADLLGIKFDKIDGIILSHGHFDHFTGLDNIIKKIASTYKWQGRGKQSPHNVDIFVHPDAFLRRWEEFPDGKKAKMPFLDEERLKDMGAKIHKNKGIRYLPDINSQFLLLTGRVPRKTGFEKGLPYQYAESPRNNNTDNVEENLNLIPDPLVKDDQALVANLRKKGLIVLTGCGHAGIINILDYAKKVTGIKKIYAIIGGFHLPADGGIYEEAMDPTIREIQNADPEYVIPCHCTGWKATNKIIDLMPSKFIQSAVGTTFTF